MTYKLPAIYLPNVDQQKALFDKLYDMGYSYNCYRGSSKEDKWREHDAKSFPLLILYSTFGRKSFGFYAYHPNSYSLEKVRLDKTHVLTNSPNHFLSYLRKIERASCAG